VLYILVPIAQTVAYIKNHNSAILLYLSLFLASIFYDAYTRDNADLSLLGRVKTIIVRVVCGVLFFFNLFIRILNAENVSVSDGLFFVYIILVIPFVFAIWDGVDHCRTEYYYLKCNSGR